MCIPGTNTEFVHVHAKNKQVNGVSMCKAAFTDSSLVVSAQGRRLLLDVLKESLDGGVG